MSNIEGFLKLKQMRNLADDNLFVRLRVKAVKGIIVISNILEAFCDFMPKKMGKNFDGLHSNILHMLLPLHTQHNYRSLGDAEKHIQVFTIVLYPDVRSRSSDV